jgi:hypothetical protein
MDMDFAISGSLVRCWRLISVSCPSTRTFAPRFFQTPPRGGLRPCASLVLHLHQIAQSRDRGTARATLGKGLVCFGVSALRARLAFSVAHVSVRPPCHPGRSHFTSPVGDHDCPCVVFPGSPWLKRSLAYTPGASGLPRSSIAAGRPSLAGTVSDMGGTSTTRHDREPLRTARCYLLGSRVEHDLDQRYPALIAPTGSCAEARSSVSLCHKL